MTAPTESPVDLDLPSVDTSPACDVESCDASADLRARYFHMEDDPATCDTGRLYLLCRKCFDASVDRHRAVFERFAGHHIECGGCHERLTCVHDLIRSVVPL
ncbi:hypothetical protein [Williamsia sp. D3]|uniref:hypothetical protein n=1 Tax=Williamsia sp. D3 TaxID=1313067 RepID=UPI0003D2E640|nr:hypothetical protein [Williamsia sp. D3]ETD31516.1 hypothetical protein W823_19190 [Williamsia sp. D3]